MAAAGTKAGTRPGYVLGLLVLAYISSYMDRIALGIFGEAIKAELGISDTQLGILTGLVFVIFYSILGLPIGRLADRYSRKKLLAACLTLWSCMTAFSGLASNFWQLMLARIGVGVGEAGLNPSTHSLLSDLYPPNKRAGAFAIYGAGPPLGVIAGALIGGWVANEMGWRAGMIAIALPGIALGLLFLFTVREPVRDRTGTTGPADDVPSLRNAVGVFLQDPLFLYVTAGMAMAAIGLYSISTFTVPYLVRVHQLNLFQASSLFGMAYGIAGAVGAWGGGWLTDWTGTRDHRWYAGMPLTGYVLGGSCLVGAFFQSDGGLLLFTGLFAVGAICVNLALAPAQAVVLGRFPARMRASASALQLLVAGVVGLGFGPTLTGYMSDRLAAGSFALGDYRLSCLASPGGAAGRIAEACQQASAQGLQNALAITLCAYMLAALAYILALKHTAPRIFTVA